MTKIKIKITKDVLERASMCGQDPEMIDFGPNCAFALAVRDIFPYAYVSDETISPVGGYGGKKFAISEEMTHFISEFDENTPEDRREMDEREFELNIPDWALKLIGSGEIKEVKKIIRNSKTLELA